MDSSQFTVDVKVVLRKNGTGSHAPAMGKGVVELCDKVDKLGSLNKAAASMGMAYSKAWRIVKNVEEVFGVSLLERRGAQGSSLTVEGRELVFAYRVIDERLQENAQETLREVMR